MAEFSLDFTEPSQMKKPLFSKKKIALKKSIYLNRDCKIQKATGINAGVIFG
jgi:hypothetical protein